MAVVFLRTEEYENCFNLNGGFSGWEKAELPVEQRIIDSIVVKCFRYEKMYYPVCHY